MSSRDASNPNQKKVKQPDIDPYLVLGISRQAEEAEIKRAYFQLVRQYPPEREPVKFQEIRTAYDLLRDPQRRARADLFLIQPPPPLPNRRAPTYDLDVHREDLLLLLFESAATPMSKDFQNL